jgi:hypothetical protein
VALLSNVAVGEATAIAARNRRRIVWVSFIVAMERKL